MLIRRQEDYWSIATPCKVNLFLEVLGKRADGYHELSTVMAAVSLCDQLIFRDRSDGEIKLHVALPHDGLQADGEPQLAVRRRFTGAEPPNELWTAGMTSRRFNTGRLAADGPAWQIPTDASNLIVRALNALQKKLGSGRGMDVWLEKSIPATAGLGGGSSDAAAALVGGMLAWSSKYDANLVSSLASQLGSDLNFFLEGGIGDRWIAHCRGRGERVQPLVSNVDWHVVIAQPPVGCSTAAVFQSLRTDVSPRLPDTMLEGIRDNDLTMIGRQLFNRLENAAQSVTHWIEELRKLFTTADASMNLHLGSVMTGSGSARFAICPSAQDAEDFAAKIGGVSASDVFIAYNWRAPEIVQQLRALGIGNGMS